MVIGAEAILPVNEFSGKGPGGLLQVHFYLDKYLPQNSWPFITATVIPC